MFFCFDLVICHRAATGPHGPDGKKPRKTKCIHGVLVSQNGCQNVSLTHKQTNRVRPIGFLFLSICVYGFKCVKARGYSGTRSHLSLNCFPL